ncbi:UNVERIFIED_CONTAM: hypothetical protein K2H54_045091 [Gekko kuhli]
MELMPIIPEALGVRAQKDQWLEAALLQRVAEQSSTGTGPVDRMVLAGPHLPPNHMVQDGGTEAAVGGRGMGKSGPKNKQPPVPQTTQPKQLQVPQAPQLPNAVAPSCSPPPSFLCAHGFLINGERSQLTPTQDLVHLGAWLNTIGATVSLPEEKQVKIQALVMDVRTKYRVDLMQLAALQGLMILTIDLVPYSQKLGTYFVGWRNTPGALRQNT